jgi:hypothetical protein
VSADNRSVDYRLLDRRIISVSCALSDGPLRTGVVLCLDCTEPRYDITWLLELPTNQVLIGKTLPSDIRQNHAGTAAKLNLRANSRLRISMLTASAT